MSLRNTLSVDMMNTGFSKTFVKILLNISLNVRKQNNLCNILKWRDLKFCLALPRIRKRIHSLAQILFHHLTLLSTMSFQYVRWHYTSRRKYLSVTSGRNIF